MKSTQWVREHAAQNFQHAALAVFAADPLLEEDGISAQIAFECWRIFYHYPHGYEQRREVYIRFFGDIKTKNGVLYEDLAHRANYIIFDALLQPLITES